MNQQIQRELLGWFGRSYPKCATLPIVPVPTADGKGFRPGYDIDDVQGVLGAVRFNKLMSGLKSTFMYAHRQNPPGHPQAGFQVHSIHADDLEAFLAGGN